MKLIRDIIIIGILLLVSFAILSRCEAGPVSLKGMECSRVATTASGTIIHRCIDSRSICYVTARGISCRERMQAL